MGNHKREQPGTSGDIDIIHITTWARKFNGKTIPRNTYTRKNTCGKITKRSYCGPHHGRKIVIEMHLEQTHYATRINDFYDCVLRWFEKQPDFEIGMKRRLRRGK